MKEKTYRSILTMVVLLGVVATLALCIYTFCVYPDSSLIAFISKEWW